MLSAALDNPVCLLPKLSDNTVTLRHVGTGAIYVPRSFPHRLSQVSDLLFGMLSR
jgi:hypothetical protein